MRQNIGREIDLFAARMGVVNRLGYRLLLEAVAARPQRKHGDTKVDGIGSVSDRVLQFFKAARRQQ